MAFLGRVLCVWPHADDGTFNASGTLAEAIRDGSEVVSVIISDSAGGGAAAKTREAEERGASKLVGIEDVRFLGYPDGKLHLDRYRTLIIRELADIIAEFKPDTIITYDEDGGLTGHQDHCDTGAYVMQTLKLVGHPVVVLKVAITGPWLRHVMPPLRDLANAIWRAGTLHAIADDELYIDNRLSGEELEAKLQAVWVHDSQIKKLVRKLEKAGGEDLLIRYWFSREAFTAYHFFVS
jgi:LmbE family N-acetylglucosaminyl deacetylase